MSYRDCLYTFLTVYRLGSQNKAAESLALTQPAVSQHLKMLEQYIGKPLFKREGRNLAPTAAAHQLALDITDPLDTLTEVLASTRKGEQKLSGEVIVGGLSHFFEKAIVPHLSALSAYDIRLRFEVDYYTLVPRLLNNEIHLAQFCEHVTHPQLTVEKLFQQQFVLVGHPKFKNLINKKQLDNKDISCLADLPWITYNETLLFIKEYYHTVFQKEFNGKIKLITGDMWTTLSATSSGFGVTVLPSFFCQDHFDSQKIQILYQTKNAPKHHFYLGWKQGALRDPKVKMVYDLYKKACIDVAIF